MSERIPTDVLVAQARKFADWWRIAQSQWGRGGPTADLLTALAKALEDTAAERDRAHATLREVMRADRPDTPPRPEPVATAHPAVTEWREVRDPESFSGFVHMREKGDALAKALEDTAAERDRAHATLREIAGDDPEAMSSEAFIARERLENP